MLGLITLAFAAEPQPFEVVLLGHVDSVQAGCVVQDEPPLGEWTLRLSVADPRGTGMVAGQELCVIVASPGVSSAKLRNGVLRCWASSDLPSQRFSCVSAAAVSKATIMGEEPAARLAAQKRGDLALYDEVVSMKRRLGILRQCKGDLAPVYIEILQGALDQAEACLATPPDQRASLPGCDGSMDMMVFARSVGPESVGGCEPGKVPEH